MSDDPTPDPTTPGDPAPQPDPPSDPTAELEALKAEARKWENRAKANSTAAQELKDLKASQMTEIERTAAEAAERAAAEAQARYAPILVAAEVKAATAGTGLDVDALLEGINAAKFLNEDGTPDGAAIAAWVGKLTPPPKSPEADQLAGIPGFPDMGQGARGNGEDLSSNPILKTLQGMVGGALG